MLPEGGSREKPVLRRRYLSPALEEFPPWEWGRWKRLPGGAGSVTSSRAGIPEHCDVFGYDTCVCMYVYLGAFTHRHEFSSGYMLLHDFEAVKEDQLDSTSLDHRAWPATTPQLLPRVVHPLPAPVCPSVWTRASNPTPWVCSAGLAPFSTTGTTGSPHSCPSSIKLTPAFRGCRSRTVQGGDEPDCTPGSQPPQQLSAMDPAPQSKHPPGSCPWSSSLSLPEAPKARWVRPGLPRAIPGHRAQPELPS